MIKCGYYVYYTLSIYNEGEVAGRATKIVDQLPTGLEFVADSAINRQYGWQQASTVGENNVVYSTDYLKDTTIDAFDKENDNYITHRITRIEGNRLVTKGDANNNLDKIVYKKELCRRWDFYGWCPSFQFSFL